MRTFVPHFSLAAVAIALGCLSFAWLCALAERPIDAVVAAQQQAHMTMILTAAAITRPGGCGQAAAPVFRAFAVGSTVALLACVPLGTMLGLPHMFTIGVFGGCLAARLGGSRERG